jgi:carboxypeptidase family protein/TonB-dependent receptor-like protein
MQMKKFSWFPPRPSGSRNCRFQSASYLAWVLALAVFIAGGTALAQKYTGTIRGVVTDPSGAMVANAEVAIVHTATGETRNVKTNTEGEYVALELQPGTYQVRVKHPNFRESVTNNVELHVASVAVANAQLQVGSISEQVTVEADQIQVETSTGAVGNVVDGSQVRELPLNGRSFVQLTQLMPGVSPQAAFSSKNKGLMSGVDFSVNGNSTTGNLFTVDGVNNNDVGSNRTILVYPSIDAIQEFKILRNSYGPEYGQAMGAIVNIATRGGTNNWHGGAFYFGRNDVLNATDYFNNLLQLPKDKLRRNDWGYNLGGPILKDKLFFFFSHEWNRELRGRTRSANVPTPEEKQGDFSNLRVASDGSPCENAPVVGGNIVTAVPAGQTSAAGALLVQLFPDPNISPSNVIPDECSNWATSLTAPIYWREESVRVDYNLGKTWKLFGRYTQDHWSQPFPSTMDFWGDDIYPSVESSWIQPGYQATIKLTKIFGGTAVNDFQVSYAANRITVNRAGTNPGLNDQITAALAPDFPLSDKQSGTHMGYPIFWGGLGDGANSDDLWTQAPWHNNQQLYVLKDDFSKIHGNHAFKVGFLVSNNQKNELANGSSGEAPNFSGVASDPVSGNTFDSTNGTFNALWNQVFWDASELQTNPFAHTRWHDVEFYYGDTWKVTKNLTLEYGFRWSFLRQPFDGKNKIASFSPAAYDSSLGGDPCNGMLVVPGTHFCQDAGFAGGVAGLNRSLKEQNNHAIAPRVGIAWDPRGDGKTSIRAGIGQFFQRERLSNYLTLANNSPFSLSAGGISRTLDVPVPQTGGTGSPSFGIDTGAALPNTWQWNLTFEHELLTNSKLELAYVGNRGIHLLRYTDINAVPQSLWLQHVFSNDDADRPFGAGNFQRIDFAEWKGASSYHALQALLRTRMKGLDAQFAYTYSKSLGDTDITNSGTSAQSTVLLDPTNPRLNYGLTPIDRRHNFVSSIVYNLPEFRGRNALMRHAVGGWELASILNYSSGLPLTVYANPSGITGADGGFTGTGALADAVRPNRVSGQPCRAPSGSPKFQWLNPAAWTVDNYVLATFGNAGIGECSGPGIANTDFSLYKNFKITERVNLQFRMEFFNLFNKTQFRANSPDTTGVDVNLTTGAVACTAASNNINDPNSVCFGHTDNTVGWSFDTNSRDNTAYGNQGFGQVQGPTKGPREIQYSLKVTF